MAVIEVLTFEVKPGRLEDFLADVRQVQQILPCVDSSRLCAANSLAPAERSRGKAPPSSTYPRSPFYRCA